jgi:hypothetical protein
VDLACVFLLSCEAAALLTMLGQELRAEGRYAHSDNGNSKSKGIPVTGREDPQGCEMLRLPHFLDSQLTDGGEVSLTRQPPFTPRNIPGTHFC